jgi:hypothetical protein
MGRLALRISLAAMRERKFLDAAPVNSSCKLDSVVLEQSKVLSQPSRIHSNRTAYHTGLAELRFFQFVVDLCATM